VTRALNRHSQLALGFCVGAQASARHDLALFRNAAAQAANILVVRIKPVGTERVDLAARRIAAASTALAPILRLRRRRDNPAAGLNGYLFAAFSLLAPSRRSASYFASSFTDEP